MSKTAQQMQEQFNEFHKNNPHVYRTIVRMTRELKAQGHNKIGMQMIIEVLRWRSMMKTIGDDYKLNNDYASFYSRLIMDNEEDLKDIYPIRTSKTDDEYYINANTQQEVKAISWI